MHLRLPASDSRSRRLLRLAATTGRRKTGLLGYLVSGRSFLADTAKPDGQLVPTSDRFLEHTAGFPRGLPSVIGVVVHANAPERMTGFHRWVPFLHFCQDLS